jgi:DNA-binding response OmpR family regulator
MKILLADDDPISRKIISGFLTRFGYQPKVVSDGMEAWGILQTSTAPQIAIFDWMMPRMSGLDAVTRLRALKKPERTYIILLSSRNSKLDIVKGLEAGADDYLVKPCDLAELQARLRVAERAIKHEQQLRKTILELENLVRRHHLLGSIAGNQVAPEPKPATATASGQPAPLRDTLVKAMGEIGLGPGEIIVNDGESFIPDFAVLLPVYRPDQGHWIDIRVEFDRRSGHAACRSLLRRGANSPQELQDVLVEMLHLVSGAPAMQQLKESAGAFSLPAVPLDNPGSPVNAGRPGGTSCTVRLGDDIRARVTEFTTEARPEARPTTELAAGDILLESVASAADPELMIASAGDILTSSRVAQLQQQRAEAIVKIVSIPTASRAHLPYGFA